MLFKSWLGYFVTQPELPGTRGEAGPMAAQVGGFLYQVPLAECIVVSRGSR